MPPVEDMTMAAPVDAPAGVKPPLAVPLAELNGASPVTTIPVPDRSLMDEVDAARAALQLVTEPAKPQLLNYLRDCFSDADNARRNSGQEEILEDCLRRRNSEYDEEEKARLRKYAMPIVFYPHTRIMCERAEAHIRDALGEEFYDLEPYNLPVLSSAEQFALRRQLAAEVVSAVVEGQAPPSEDEMQSELERRRDAIIEERKAQAKERVKRKKQYLGDMLALGKFMRELRSYWANKITFGTGFLAGPEGKIVKVRDEHGKPVDRLVPAFEAFNPIDGYPAPWSIEVGDGFFFRRMLLTRQYLTGKISRPGRAPVRWWQGAEISALLMDQPKGNVAPLTADSNRPELELKDQGAVDNRFDTKVHHGTISGALLLDWKIENVDATANYSVMAAFSGDKIVLVKTNWDDMERQAITKSCFKRRPGSFWGEGMARRIRFSQDEGNFIKICQQAELEWLAQPWRGLQVDRLVDPNDAQNQYPGKFNLLHKPAYGDQSKVFEVVEQRSHQQEFLMVFSRNKDEVDVLGAVPTMMQGNDKASSGVGRTYSGAAMMRSDAQRGLKDALVESDEYALGPSLQMAADYVSEYAPDLGIDDQEALSMQANVKATGSTGLALKEQKLEKIAQALDRLVNPIAMAALGAAGPATYISLLKQFCDLMEINIPEFPTEVEIAKNSEAIHQQVLAKVYAAMGVPAGQPAEAQPTAPALGQPAPMVQPAQPAAMPQGAQVQ